MTKYEFLKEFINFKTMFDKDCYKSDGYWLMGKERHITLEITSYNANDEMDYKITHEKCFEIGAYLGVNEKDAFQKFVEYVCEQVEVVWEIE